MKVLRSCMVLLALAVPCVTAGCEPYAPEHVRDVCRAQRFPSEYCSDACQQEIARVEPGCWAALEATVGDTTSLAACAARPTPSGSGGGLDPDGGLEDASVVERDAGARVDAGNGPATCGSADACDAIHQCAYRAGEPHYSAYRDYLVCVRDQSLSACGG